MPGVHRLTGRQTFSHIEYNLKKVLPELHPKVLVSLCPFLRVAASGNGPFLAHAFSVF